MKKKSILKIIALVMALSLMLTSAVFAMPPGQYKKFLRNKHNYNTAAEYMKRYEIIKGYGNGNFGYVDYVKRGDITVMIVRAFKLSTTIEDFEESFPDVDIDSYFYNAISVAKKFGIARGDGKFFNPNKHVTVEEAILLIERSAAVANRNVTIYDVDLRDLFDDAELDNSATRQDIALMLYYVLTGEVYDDENEEEIKSEDIVYEVEENNYINFDSDDFVKVFKEIRKDKGESLEYVKFELPSVRYGKLYYDYDVDEDYNSMVTESTRYYADNNDKKEISDVTFVPKLNYFGSVKIEYEAYTDEGDSYIGLIIINVEEDEDYLNTIKYTTTENTPVTFDEDDFEEIFEEVTDEDMEYVKFTLPSYKTGTLWYDNDNDEVKVDKNEKYEVDKIDEITFVPYKNYSGTVVIKYKAYDEDDKVYTGEISIEVKDDYVIDTIELKTDEDKEISFDFDYKLEKSVEEDIYDDFEYVIFEIPKREDGRVYIEYDDEYELVEEDKKYRLYDIDELTFVPKDDGVVNIDYLILDDDKEEYGGTIEITVE
ncbi:S-layer homology domain-containing protein [Sedimentibacter sp. MB31-C6]|uniref:S-layer homology domain-containing protein n=1 Tax=Sedimentibacter sp. MB31-C6 TaxID=3109366 RepID=UPI002DDD0D74|nr:S-layer homology domain-containing protein [Sedimentibacter sp. MB36-C1]WSI03276.1 S-layer homology domain-containing protein [Sedimentibacter sp. MB36-C1]